MNLIFTAFATLEGYREGSNANLGSEVFYRCIVVSLVSAKQKNQNCDAALVTNTAVPEPYAAQLSQAGIRVIACPFDNYRFEADLDWSLAYYKLCAMQYLLETEHYENYLMLDSDTFTQRGYQDIWREAAEAVLLYQVPHAASQPMTARISHTYDELWPEGAPHVLTHFGGEFVAGSTARLQDFMAECRNVFDRMQQTGVRSQDGDEEPGDHGAEREVKAGVLHDEQRGHEDEGRAAVHVDRRADRQDEARDARVDLEACLSRGERYWQRAGRALREERDGDGRCHLAEDVERVEAAREQEERDDDEELDDVAAEHDGRVLAERADDDAGLDLRRELRGKGEDAERQVAAGRGEDLLGFEEHAAADDDADDECDRRRKAILFLQFIVHKFFFFFPPDFLPPISRLKSLKNKSNFPIKKYQKITFTK